MHGRPDERAPAAARDGGERRRRRLFGRFFVALAATAVVLLGLFVLAGFREIGDSARDLDLALLVPAALILAVAMPPLAALRWYLILRRCGAPVAFAPLLRAYIVSNVLNLFMPGPVGDLTVTTHLKGQQGVPVGMGFSSLMLAKLSMGLVNAALLLGSLPMVARLHLEDEIVTGLVRTVVLVVGALGVLALAALLPRTSMDRVRAIFRTRLERLSSKAARKAGEAVEGFTASFMSCVWTTLRSPGLLLVLVLIALVKTGMLVIAFMLAAEAVGFDGHIWDCMFLAPSYTFLLLSSTWIPGAVGPPELFLVAWSAGLAGYEAGDGVLFGLLVKLVILVGALGSTCYLLPVRRPPGSGEGG